MIFINHRLRSACAPTLHSSWGWTDDLRFRLQDLEDSKTTWVIWNTKWPKKLQWVQIRIWIYVEKKKKKKCLVRVCWSALWRQTTMQCASPLFPNDTHLFYIVSLRFGRSTHATPFARKLLLLLPRSDTRLFYLQYRYQYVVYTPQHNGWN